MDNCNIDAKELYLCDPEKNKNCTKEMCHIHGGLCSLTTDPYCSYTKANGEPIKEEEQ